MGDVTGIGDQTRVEALNMLTQVANRCAQMHQNAGVLVIYCDEYGIAEVAGQANLHPAEIISACFQVATATTMEGLTDD